MCNLRLNSRGAWLRLFLLRFLSHAPNPTVANDCDAKSGSTHDETKKILLKSASGLTRRFRFVSTVIILQQMMGARNLRAMMWAPRRAAHDQVASRKFRT